MSRLCPLSLGALRQCVQPEFAALPAEDLEELVASSTSSMPDDTAEDFMRKLGSWSRAVAPALQRAVPGVAQGAITGASLGGPWGALIGAGARLTSRSTGRSARPTAPALPPTPSTAGLPIGHAASATLVSLLQNPTVQQALMSQALGAYGRQQVPTASGTSVPRGAINSLLAQLLANASEALPESESISEQEYLQEESGEYLIDTASPEQQAARVLSYLQSAPADGLRYSADEILQPGEWMLEELDDSQAEWLESDESNEMVRFY